jgi:hypothetical protein
MEAKLYQVNEIERQERGLTQVAQGTLENNDLPKNDIDYLFSA